MRGRWKVDEEVAWRGNSGRGCTFERFTLDHT